MSIRHATSPARGAIAATLAAALLLITTSAAVADETAPDPESASFSDAEIIRAIEAGEAAEASGDATTSDQALEQQLIDAARENGEYLLDADVTVAHLTDHGLRVDLALPEDVTLDSITIRTLPETDEIAVISQASADESALSTETAGPGMGSWAWNNEGQYVLKVYNGDGTFIGDGLFLWKRYKLSNDGSAAYDWWSYTRHGYGQAKDIFGDNYQIKLMKIASYPYDGNDSLAEGLINWSGMDPAEDFNNCDSESTYNTSFSLGGDVIGGFSFTPQECEEYDVWRNAEIPGSYRLTYDQGSYVNEGNRAIAYTVAWRSEAGTPGSQHDFQQINFQRNPTGSVQSYCKTYDSNGSCSYTQ